MCGVTVQGGDLRRNSKMRLHNCFNETELCTTELWNLTCDLNYVWTVWVYFMDQLKVCERLFFPNCRWRCSVLADLFIVKRCARAVIIPQGHFKSGTLHE